ncbi:hypothetical protein RCH23_001934 [Cryobacterium sp. CAN_C3]|nr:hypothetical protein [Cryobacterium sp. CAN_C3]MEC5154553.1 hypothetical protein [Cryobacterium sp. CAN_C3]
MLTTGETYLGHSVDHYAKLDPERIKRRARKELDSAGFDAVLTKRAA